MNDAMTATFLLSPLIGIIAGLRAMIAPAAVSWAARLGWLDLSGTGLEIFGYAFTPWILTVFALGELVTDQLPSTPPRTVPIQFATRVIMGAASGAAVAAPQHGLAVGLMAGAIGAVIGTLGGRMGRSRLAAAFGNDRPAAFIEDAIAIGGAILVAAALR
jgi:uncharacterized membrane protein